MTTPSPWTGVPSPNQNTFVTSGDLWVYGSILPVGVLSLYRETSGPLNLNMVGGGFGYGLDIYTAGVTGDVNLNVMGLYYPYNGFVTSATIFDLYGTFNINVSGGITAVNYGSIIANQGDSTQAINVNLQQGTSFYNYGQIAASNAGPGNSSVTVNLDQQTTFTNNGLINVEGPNAFINLWSAPPNSPNGVASGQFLAPVTNNGEIQASGNGVVFLTAPVKGTGLLDAENGGKLKFSGPVASSETVSLNGGVLEFGPKGGFANPAMQFLAPITGETSASTILLDGAVGVVDDFTVLGQPGSGLGELKVYDVNHSPIADLKFVGNFSASNFVLTAHPASSPSDSWTAISFVGNPNS